MTFQEENIQDYFKLLKNKKWFYTDGPTGIIKHPEEYLMYDEKYEYYFANDLLESKEMYHFADDCIFDSTKIGEIRFGKYMIMSENMCYEVENLGDSIFTYWVNDLGRFHILEVK